jgi:DNA (cytosine-5)-methyltransferase 1
MNYLSVCSGIEAATVAWHPLGWTPVAFSEIEKFPSEVLKHHYPQVPNVGDMTKFKEWNLDSNVDVFVGGTPCQSFSVAGLRKGLDDPRGNLMLTYLAIANQYRPKWLVWENVPGVLSSNGGLDFASLLRGMGECGYGFAYRILDAQYFGVAQRRRRVFVVGCLGDWRSAAAVLFERYSLQRNFEPSREKRESITGFVESGFGAYREDQVGGTTKASGGVLGGGSETFLTVYENHATDSRINEVTVCPTVTARWGTGGNNVPYTLYDLHQVTSPQNRQNRKDGDPCHTLAKDNAHNAGLIHPVAYNITFCDANGTRSDRPNGGLYVNETEVTSTLTNAGVGTNVVQPMTFSSVLSSQSVNENSQVSQTLESKNPMAVAFTTEQTPKFSNEKAHTLTQSEAKHNQCVMQAMAVRRLTPKECERLQGFPDNYTDIKPKNKATPDGPRYKALGNSMAVPVMAWIGKRIQEVENIKCKPNK